MDFLSKLVVIDLLLSFFCCSITFFDDAAAAIFEFKGGDGLDWEVFMAALTGSPAFPD